MSLRRMLRASAAIAGASCLGPFVFAGESQFGWAVYVSILLSAAWIFVLTAAVIRHKARGFWILCGLPFAALWPAFYVLLAMGLGARK
jgi:hypothetical protein